MLVTIFDYGAGNLHSLQKAIETVALEAEAGAGAVAVAARIESDPMRAIETDVLVLPGVGNFGSAASRLAAGRVAMRDAIVGGLPTLGICLGMQLLFHSSEESAGLGLSVFDGRVRRVRARRVPHMGWNDGFYYAHSYACEPADAEIVRRWVTHEQDVFPAVVSGCGGAAVGVQFHPEKSGTAGLRFLRDMVKRWTRSGTLAGPARSR